MLNNKKPHSRRSNGNNQSLTDDKLIFSQELNRVKDNNCLYTSNDYTTFNLNKDINELFKFCTNTIKSPIYNTNITLQTNGDFDETNNYTKQSAASTYLERRHEDTQRKLLSIKNEKESKELKELTKKPNLNIKSYELSEKNSHINVFSRLTNKNNERKRIENLKRIENQLSEPFKPTINKRSNMLKRTINDLYNSRKKDLEGREIDKKRSCSVGKLVTNIKTETDIRTKHIRNSSNNNKKISSKSFEKIEIKKSKPKILAITNFESLNIKGGNKQKENKALFMNNDNDNYNIDVFPPKLQQQLDKHLKHNVTNQLIDNQYNNINNLDKSELRYMTESLSKIETSDYIDNLVKPSLDDLIMHDQSKFKNTSTISDDDLDKYLINNYGLSNEKKNIVNVKNKKMTEIQEPQKDNKRFAFVKTNEPLQFNNKSIINDKQIIEDPLNDKKTKDFISIRSNLDSFYKEKLNKATNKQNDKVKESNSNNSNTKYNKYSTENLNCVEESTRKYISQLINFK